MSTSPPGVRPSDVLAPESLPPATVVPEVLESADGPGPQPVRPLVAVAGRDTDAAISSLAGMYAGNEWYSCAVDDRYWFRYVGVGDDQLSVRRSQMHGYLRGDAAVEGEVVVQWLERGRARVDVGGDEVRMRPGVPVLFPIERRFVMEYEDWDQRLVHLSSDLVRDVASDRWIVTGPLSFDQSAAPTPAAVYRWRAAVAGAVRTLRRDGLTSLAWTEARRDVARALLELWPLRAERVSPGCGALNERRLRAAVEYIREHAREPLAVADVARAVDVSVRTLQDTFQRDFRVCPTVFLCEVRLDGAHEELVAAHPGELLVSDAARRWGFSHMGRFSAAYADRFGEYPRETLQR